MAKPRDKNPPLAFLHECFVVREDGTLIWKRRPREHFTTFKGWATWNGKNAGKEAGTLSHGYVQVSLNNRLFKAHRIVFAVTTGAWPIDEVDHRNGVRSENRPDNLREASVTEQAQNHTLNKNNTSGFTGVFRDRKWWQAGIGSHGRFVHLGRFDTPEAAYQAYLAAKQKFHPFQPVPRR